jgi:hypothetical protein
MQHAWRDEKYIQNFSMKPEGRDHSEDVGEDKIIILKCILRRTGVRIYIDSGLL